MEGKRRVVGWRYACRLKVAKTMDQNSQSHPITWSLASDQHDTSSVYSGQRLRHRVCVCYCVHTYEGKCMLLPPYAVCCTPRSKWRERHGVSRLCAQDLHAEQPDLRHDAFVRVTLLQSTSVSGVAVQGREKICCWLPLGPSLSIRAPCADGETHVALIMAVILC